MAMSSWYTSGRPRGSLEVAARQGVLDHYSLAESGSGENEGAGDQDSPLQ